MLRAIALPSILNQCDPNFEWVVVNDGQDSDTRDLITGLSAFCTVTYLEMPHPPEGFGLCHARNLGLNGSSGNLIAYLDDDNAIAPQFVAQTKRFMGESPSIRCSMAQQWRRRDVVQDGLVVKSGKPFISPIAGCSIEALISQQALFDSNGFVHYRQDSPLWNPCFKVFADYAFFLSCLGHWGRKSFKLQETLLVHYVQRSDGVIGRSGYGEWAIELERIVMEHQSCLAPDEVIALKKLVKAWQQWQQQDRGLSGFMVSG